MTYFFFLFVGMTKMDDDSKNEIIRGKFHNVQYSCVLSFREKQSPGWSWLSTIEKNDTVVVAE